MELRHLRYLIAVADAGTFVRAAEVLRVAQPALSRQINDLERELKVDLFEEGARKATLTDAGRAAVRIARHIVDDTERAVARARMSDLGLLGTCTLSSGPVPLMAGLVAQLVGRMRQRHPSITLAVREGAFPQQWEEIANAVTDVGLGAAPPPAFQSLAFETQMTLTVDIAVLSPAHPLADRESVRLADLQGTTFLALDDATPDTDTVRDMMLLEIDRQRLDFGRPRFFSSIESMLIHVRAGQGWTLMPQIFARTLAPLRGPRLEDFQALFRVTRMWRRADKRPITRTVLNELRALQLEGFADGGSTPAPTKRPEPKEFVPARLDLRHLRSFVEVAESGSLGRAAESLSISQPALSRQMRELEYDVGVPLLDRGTRGVELTAAGQALQTDAQGVLSVVDRLPAEVRRAKRGTEERRCVVGAVPHPGVEEILARVVAEMESRSPRVRVGTRDIGTPSIRSLLHRSELDIAIGFALPARVPSDTDLAHVRLADDELGYAVLPKSHPLALEAIISLSDLVDLPFVFPSREEFPPLYDVVMHQFDAAAARPRVHLEYSGIKTMSAMIAQGLGWAVGARSFLAQPPAGTALVKLSNFKLPWGIELVYRKDESRAAILETIDAIIAAARHLFPPPLSTENATLPNPHASRAVIS